MTISWQEISSSDVFTYSKQWKTSFFEKNGFSITTEWAQAEVNRENNTSIINMQISVSLPKNVFYYYSESSAKIGYYWTWEDNAENRTPVELKFIPKQHSSNNNTFKGYLSFKVKHNSDGTLKARIGIHWRAKSNDGDTLYDVPSDFNAYAPYFDGEAIPRLSEIISANMDNEKGEYSCVFKSSGYVEQAVIKLSNGAKIKTVRPYLQNQIIKLEQADWEMIYRQSANIDKGAFEIIFSLETYELGYTKQLGTDERKKPFLINDKPEIKSYEITENGSFKNVVGNIKDYVRFLSHKRMTIVAEGKKYASIKSIKVTYGNVKRTYSTNMVDDIFENISNDSDRISISITVTDSRNNEENISITTNYIMYDYPVIQNLSVLRDGDTDDATLKSSGIYWNGTINNVQNRIVLSVVGGGNSTGLVSNHDGIKWNDTRSIIGADPNQSFTYKVTALDSFGQSISRNVTLSVMKPIMQFGKSQVDVNGNFAAYEYYVKTDDGTYSKLNDKYTNQISTATTALTDTINQKTNELTNKVNQQLGQLNQLKELKNKQGDLYKFMRDLIYPIGSVIYNDNRSFDPNTEIGGSWSKVEGRFIVGSGDGYTMRMVGGNKTHTHGSTYVQNNTLTALIGQTVDNGAGIGLVVSQGVDTTKYPRVANTRYANNANYKNNTLAYAAAVYGETTGGSSIPPYYCVNIWRRTA
jgi:hypothetical protein